MTKKRQVFVAVPALDELDYLPALVNCLRKQTLMDFKTIVCVNQPDDWWQDPNREKICFNNQESLSYLSKVKGLDLELIDKSTKGNGWVGKQGGVGWARRIIMDRIAAFANDHDLIVSMDADTSFNPAYLQSLIETFDKNEKTVGLAVPYYHKLTGNEIQDRAILHYEIFMRYFSLNLWRIKSPYSFTAIGSAIVLPVKSYKAIGGITPHRSGEDFYLLQKLRKYGSILSWNPEKVFPAARYSERVGFGTGPAMIKGSKGDWKSYPIYPWEYFDDIEATYSMFGELFQQDLETPLDKFLYEKFDGKNIWQPLRKNSRTEKQFIRACFIKLDAFRMLQYLKWKDTESVLTDEENLKNWTVQFHSSDLVLDELVNADFSFEDSPVEILNGVRERMITFEESYQKANDLLDI